MTILCLAPLVTFYNETQDTFTNSPASLSLATQDFMCPLGSACWQAGQHPSLVLVPTATNLFLLNSPSIWRKVCLCLLHAIFGTLSYRAASMKLLQSLEGEFGVKRTSLSAFPFYTSVGSLEPSTVMWRVNKDRRVSQFHSPLLFSTGKTRVENELQSTVHHPSVQDGLRTCSWELWILSFKLWA